jgi:hypothetical protein
MRKTVKTVLARATRITRKGWCQGTAAMDGDGNRLNHHTDPGAIRFCLSTAIEKALTDLGLRAGSKRYLRLSAEAHGRVRKAIERRHGRRGTGTDLDVVVRYNDARCRRRGDVLRMLSRAKAASGKR